jgi:hypothetical protein
MAAPRYVVVHDMGWDREQAMKVRDMMEELHPGGCWAIRACPMCVEIGEGMGPSHDGSTGCESGSLASGGSNSHCTCDVCF